MLLIKDVVFIFENDEFQIDLHSSFFSSLARRRKPRGKR
jgi:hypothetical protein